MVIGWVLHGICESAAGVAVCGVTNEADLVAAVEFVGAVGFDVPHARVVIASTLQAALILTDISILRIHSGSWRPRLSNSSPSPRSMIHPSTGFWTNFLAHVSE